MSINLTEALMTQKQKETEGKEVYSPLKMEIEYYTMDQESQEYKDFKEVEKIVHDRIVTLMNEDKEVQNVNKCMELVEFLERYRSTKTNISSMTKFQYPTKPFNKCACQTKI